MKRLFLSLILSYVSFISITAQTVTPEQYFSKGLEAFEEKNYEVARMNMRAVVNMSTSTPSQRDMAKDIIGRCDEMIGTKVVSSVTLEISETNIQFAAEGDTKEVSITSNVKWSVEAMPTWCKVIDSNARYVKFWCDLNPTSSMRPGQITIKAGGMTREIFVYQDAGAEKNGRVFFRVNPNNAYLESSDGSVGYSSSPLVLSRHGKYKVKISKDGYQPVDTTIFINNVIDTMRIVDVDLKPLFGKLYPLFLDEEGREIKNVDFKIGRTIIDLDDVSNRYSYDDKERIEYLRLYKDGMIPLNQGVYDVHVSAPGYESFNEKINIKAGQVMRYEKELKSMLGYLVVKPGRNAVDAIVEIPDLKMTASVGDTLAVPIGKHDVFVSKDGYLLDVGVFDVDIQKAVISEVTANLSKMVELKVSTKLGGESVYINDEHIKYQEPFHRIPLTEGEEYKVSIRKKGYWNINKNIIINGEDAVNLTDLEFEPIDTIRFRANEPDLIVELKKKGDALSDDYAEGKRIPTVKGKYVDLIIPHGKYQVKLIRPSEYKESRRLAYNGTLNFTGEKEAFSFNTWTKRGISGLRFISVDINPVKIAFDKQDKKFQTLARLKLAEFNICKGLTSSLVKGAIFDTSELEIPFGVSPLDGETSRVLMGFTCAFLNYDFRVGGHSFRKGDLNALISYSLYPSMTEFGIDLSHFAGHELFCGLEASPRFKSFNMSLRIGVEFLNGKRNYFYSYYDYSKPVDEDEHYVTGWEAIPERRTTFVIGLNFSIGASGSRGENILRLF